MREKIASVLCNLNMETNNYICDGCGSRSTEEVCVQIADHLIVNDVVPVVRCCDCQYCDVYQKEADSETMLICMIHSFQLVDPTDFCSKGERKYNG